MEKHLFSPVTIADSSFDSTVLVCHSSLPNQHQPTLIETCAPTVRNAGKHIQSIQEGHRVLTEAIDPLWSRFNTDLNILPGQKIVHEHSDEVTQERLTLDRPFWKGNCLLTTAFAPSAETNPLLACTFPPHVTSIFVRSFRLHEVVFSE